MIKDDSQFKLGKQEDAEEFLSCILNLLHEEMVAAIKVIDDDKSSKWSLILLKQRLRSPNFISQQCMTLQGYAKFTGNTNKFGLEGDDSASTNGDCPPDDASKPDEEDEEEDGQWEQVGPKNKSVITRTVCIFGSRCALILNFR